MSSVITELDAAQTYVQRQTRRVRRILAGRDPDTGKLLGDPKADAAYFDRILNTPIPDGAPGADKFRENVRAAVAEHMKTGR